jgi:Ca2+-binding RTX toxin-like protein
LGSGDDTFIWNPGDGSDTVDGQAGTDTLLFNGSNAGENVAISANGSHVLFTRDVGAITMNLNAIEHIEFNALGGADHVVVNDLSGTGVKEVDIDLSATGGGGDGQPDTVTVNGTAGKDHITVTSSGASIVVNGLPAQVAITGAEPGNDSLIINGGAGNDTIDASGLPAGTMSMTLAGGAGNDTLVGGGENDTFLFTSGEGGHDVIQGFQAHGASQQGDIVALAAFADHSFDQLVANNHIVQSGADVVVSDGTSVVATLQHIVLASLHANDFAFS